MRPLFFLATVTLALVACERPKAWSVDTPAPVAPVTLAATPPDTGPLEAPQVSASSAAEGPPSPVMPAVFPGPVVFPQTCEGESCEVQFPALACAAVELRSAPADTASVAARIAPGDTVEVRTRDLHVLEPGRIVLRRDFALTEWQGEGGRHPRSDTLRFAAGDTVYLLRYIEVGAWTWWHRGRLQDGDEFWAGPLGDGPGAATHSSDSSVAVALSHPIRADWWRVEPRSGRAGWWRADTLYGLMSIPRMEKWNDECPKR